MDSIHSLGRWGGLYVAEGCLSPHAIFGVLTAARREELEQSWGREARAALQLCFRPEWGCRGGVGGGGGGIHPWAACGEEQGLPGDAGLAGSLVRGHWRHALGVGATLALLSLRPGLSTPSLPTWGLCVGLVGYMELPLGWLLFL